MNGTSEKFSRSSRAFSNMSDFYGVASNMSAEYGIVIMSRQQSKAGGVIAVGRTRLRAEEGAGRSGIRRKDCVFDNHRTVLALPPRIKRGW